MVYGQTEVTRDLMAARAAAGAATVYEAEDVRCTTSRGRRGVCLHPAGTAGGAGVRLRRRVRRLPRRVPRTVPAGAMRAFERVYPFGWLGVLVDKPPVATS